MSGAPPPLTLHADPRFAKLVPVQRPQEALTPQAVDAMVSTLNRIEGAPLTGAPLQLAVTAGDAIDNAQWNELQAVLALLNGGLVRAGSGGARYEGVQALDWPDDIFWRPDGVGAGGPDIFRAVFGFPTPSAAARLRPGRLRGGRPAPALARLLRQPAVGSLTRSPRTFSI